MTDTNEQMENRRKKDRRQYRTRPTFPLIDSDGNLVEKNRRRLVDRRLAHMTDEELEEARHDHRAEVHFHGKEYLLDAAKPELILGRTHLCDIQVLLGPISREHAKLYIKDGHIYFEDTSTNGSYICIGGGKETQVRRSSVQIHGEGIISLGFECKDNKDNLINFKVS
jgi:hypothetical protein